MHNAKLYHQINQSVRRDVKECLSEFSHLLTWGNNDSLLDIGCGIGDVTIEYILPLMSNGSKIVGLDSSENMVKFATEQYGHLENVEFILKNIADDINPGDLKTIGQFQHVTSFYCLHWVKNQRKAFENIYKFLQPNGDCLLMMTLNHSFYAVCKRLAVSEKWSSYRSMLTQSISPYNDSDDALSDLSTVMRDAGFRNLKIQIKNYSSHLDITSVKNFLLGILIPFAEKLPLQNELFKDFFQVANELGLFSDTNKIIANSTVLIAYGKK